MPTSNRSMHADYSPRLVPREATEVPLDGRQLPAWRWIVTQDVLPAETFTVP